MSEPAYTTFDFRNAATSDCVVRSLKTWIFKSQGSFSSEWEATAGSQASLRCSSILSRTFEEGVRSVDGACIGYALLLGAEQSPTLACITIRDAIAIASTLVGNGLDGDRVERKLTSIEISLCRMLMETFGSALSIAFAGSEPLKIQTGEHDEAPQLSRLIPVEELVLCTKIELLVDSKEASLTWLLPRKSIEQIFEKATGTKVTRSTNHPRDIVLQLPLEVVGILGETEMEMAEVADLAVGDIVTLNQKIDEPLPVCIDGKTVFHCWPGRIGRRQGLQIEKLI